MCELSGTQPNQGNCFFLFSKDYCPLRQLIPFIVSKRSTALFNRSSEAERLERMAYSFPFFSLGRAGNCFRETADRFLFHYQTLYNNTTQNFTTTDLSDARVFLEWLET